MVIAENLKKEKISALKNLKFLITDLSFLYSFWILEAQQAKHSQKMLTYSQKDKKQ